MFLGSVPVPTLPVGLPQKLRIWVTEIIKWICIGTGAQPLWRPFIRGREVTYAAIPPIPSWARIHFSTIADSRITRITIEVQKHNQQVSTSWAPATPEEYAKRAEDYELPKVVKAKLDADIQQAQSIAIVITLLAGALISLTSILGGIDSALEGSNGWRGFRVILWAAIIFGVGEAFVCILAIKMCAELPLLAMEKHTLSLREESALSPTQVEVQQTGRNFNQFRARYLLLERVGMHPLYWLVDWMVIWILVFASVLSFVTLFYWVLQTMSIVTSMLVVISFLMVVAIVPTVFSIAMGFGRHRY